MPSALVSATGFSMAISRAPHSIPVRTISTRRLGRVQKQKTSGRSASASWRTCVGFSRGFRRRPQAGGGGIHPGVVDVADAHYFEMAVSLKRGSVVHAALAHADYHHTVFASSMFTAHLLRSHSRTFSIDVIHFLRGQFGEHRQGDAAGGIAFGVGNGAGDARLFAPRISFLLVDGDGVVALGVDAVGVEEVQQCVAMRRLPGFDHIEMVDVPVSGLLIRKCEGGCVLQARRIARGPLPAQVVPLVDVLQLGAQDARRGGRPAGCCSLGCGTTVCPSHGCAACAPCGPLLHDW